jgi:predicted glycosyltransferase/glycosyltransferase involved in cell wall biosynthesis
MKAFFHILVNSADEELGGMESSVSRIANSFSEMGRTRVAIYERLTESVSNRTNDNLEVVSLRPIRSLLAEPLDQQSFDKDIHENSRLDKLCFSFLVRQRQLVYSEFRHVIVSFYISSTGFVAQHVANELNLPHVACVRGTDFNKDFFSPYRFPGVEFVLKNANFIVTTNDIQKATLSRYLGRHTEIKTIHNSLSDDLLSVSWRPHNRPFVQFIADGGYSYKKSTHVLMKSIVRVSEAGLPVRLRIVGSTNTDQEPYWRGLKEQYGRSYPGLFDLQDYVPRSVVKSLLLESDIYCSASIGEGCSNGSLLALGLGLPIVSTDTGALAELAGNDPSIFLSAPGDVLSLEGNLSAAAKMCLEKRLAARKNVSQIQNKVSRQSESDEWLKIISEVLPRRHEVKKSSQKRVLFFVHDGTGLGHLRRLSRLASEVQGECASLVVTGHRAASFIVPEHCEFVHLPSFDSLIPNKARYWGRKPFLNIARDDAIRLRTRLLQSVITSFKPDAIIVDYLPLGKYDELGEIVRQYDALKYFVIRGVLDHTDNVRLDILGGDREHALATNFTRILVSADRSICDVANEYDFGPAISSKITYIGYVSNPISSHTKNAVRAARGLHPNDIWVVCSAGGGALGEKGILECEKLARAFPEYQFDIILGPRSSNDWNAELENCVIDGNIRSARECHNLPVLHGAADIVICPGGYNSLVESMEGGGRIICMPAQLRSNDEQYIHCERLKRVYPIEVVTRVGDLATCFKSVVEKVGLEIKPIRQSLNFDGVANFKEILFDDLGIS